MLWLAAPIAARWGGLMVVSAYANVLGLGRVLATHGLDARHRDHAARGRVRWPWLLVLLVPAVVVTALDPWTLTQAGFWLSFMAVGLLMASSYATATPTSAASAAEGWREWPARPAPTCARVCARR